MGKILATADWLAAAGNSIPGITFGRFRIVAITERHYRTRGLARDNNKLEYTPRSLPVTALSNFGKGEPPVIEFAKVPLVLAILTFALACACETAAASVRVAGQVQAGGGPFVSSTITLWAASAGEPKQLAQARSDSDGRFELRTDETPGKDVVLYVIAKGGAGTKTGSGDNPATTLLSVLGNNPPAQVVINEMTTVASAFTAAQFIKGDSISGNPLGLRIAAGNAPNLVDPTTGAWGKVLLDPAQQHANHHTCKPKHSRLADCGVCDRR